MGYFSSAKTKSDSELVIDANFEYDETFQLRLFNPENAFFTIAARLLSHELFVVSTITNEEDRPTLSIDDRTAAEASGSAAFSVLLSNPSDRPITVAYATAGGTGVLCQDFTAASCTLAFALSATTNFFDVQFIAA